MKLSVKVGIIFAILSVLAIVIFGGFSFHQTRGLLVDSIGASQLETTKSKMAEIDRFLYERYQDIAAIAKDEEYEGLLAGLEEDGVGPQDESIQEIKELSTLSGPWDWLAIIDEKGEVIISNLERELGVSVYDTPENPNTKAFESVLQGEVYYSDLVISSITGKPTVVFAAPIKDEDENPWRVVGAAIGQISWAVVEEILEDSGAAHIHLYNANGEGIAESKPPYGSTAIGREEIAEHVKRALAAESGFLVGRSNGHDFESLNTYVPQLGFLGYEGSGWGLVIEIPTEVAFSSATRNALILVVVLLPLTLGIVLVAYFLVARIVIEPIAKITVATEEIGKGNLDKRLTLKSNDEIGKLAMSFNQMTTKLQESYQTLERKVKERTKELAIKNQAVESSLTAIGITDLEGRVVYVNNAAIKMWGYSDSGDVIGKPLTDFFATDRSTMTMKNLKEKGYDSGEDVGKREDGSTFDALFSANVIKGEEDKPIAILGSFMDITERKKTERRIVELNEVLKILNKILRHDILNDLSVAEGNIDTYLEYGEPKNVKELLEIVLESVSRSEALIEKMRDLEKAVSSGQALGVVDSCEVIKEVSKGFDKLKVEVEGCMKIQADSAFSSIVVNILRNAVYHGGAKNVKVSFKDVDNMAEIRLADDGKGIPNDIKGLLFQEGAKFGETGNTGLGLYIIRKTVERYGGSVSIEDNKPKGAIFVLKIPKAA